MKADLEEAYKRHKEELEIQQLQHFQTFRNYREVFEEQKSAIEQRYRTLLEEAIQDAVFLSTRNQELMHENQVLKQGNGITGEDSRTRAQFAAKRERESKLSSTLRLVFVCP